MVNIKLSKNNLYELYIMSKYNSLEKDRDIYVYEVHKNYRKEYVIDSVFNLKENLLYYQIINDDIIEGVLDFTKFKGFKNLSMKIGEVDTLIIDKEDIKSLAYIRRDFPIKVNKIIIRDNDMKLFSEQIVEFNDLMLNGENYILSDNDKKLIYIDKSNNLKIFDKDKILKDDNVDTVEFIRYDEYFQVLIKYKDNTYNLIDDIGEYIIDYEFTNYVVNNIVNYFGYDTKGCLNYLRENDWLIILKKCYVGKEKFYNMYNDYITFKEKYDKLKEIGLSNEFFLYLKDRNLDKIIYYICSKDKTIEDVSKDEIDILNELGEKVKKLKKIK